jgi:hypothetical protein
MPIDASIPLQARGVQLASPAEQLNMMSSAAQLSEYQRGIGEQNALRDLMSSGVDIKSPEALKQMYAISPSMGMRFEKEQAGINKTAMEGKKLGLDVDQKKMDIQREKFGNLVFNPSNANITAHIEDSVLKGDIPARQAQELLQKVLPLNADQRKQFFTEMGTKAEQRLSNQTTIRGQNITAGTAANRLEFDRQQAQNPEMQLVQMEDGSYAGVNKRTGQAMPITMGQPPVNALAPSAPTQGDGSNMLAPTVAPTTAPAPQPLRGKPNVGTPVSVMINGVPTMVSAQDAIGMTPVTAATEKTASIDKGKSNVDSILTDMFGNYAKLNEMKAIPSPKNDWLTNTAAYAGAVVPAAGRAVGTEAQTERDAISQKRFTLVQAIKKATGMSAQEMNSNVELQNLLDAATSPAFSMESNLQAMNNLSRVYGNNDVYTAKGVLTGDKAQAYNWAKENPTSEDAKAILKVLGN